MASHPFCCKKCDGTKDFFVTICRVSLEGKRVCLCLAEKFVWSWEEDFGSFIDETCTECGEVGNCGPMVALDYEDPEGEEKFICSPLCLQKWIAKNLAARVIQKAWRKLKETDQ